MCQTASEVVKSLDRLLGSGTLARRIQIVFSMSQDILSLLHLTSSTIDKIESEYRGETCSNSSKWRNSAIQKNLNSDEY